MAQNTNFVAAASPLSKGGVWVAPLGTTLPTGPDDPLDPAFVGLGYVSEDGVQYSGDAASSDDTLAWGGDVVATLRSQASVDRRTFKLLEVINPAVLDFTFGAGNVVLTEDADGGMIIEVTDRAQEPPKSVFVFEMITSQNTAYRRLIPLGQPQMSGQDSDVHSAVGGYEFEVTAFKNADGFRTKIWHHLTADMSTGLTPTPAGTAA